LACCFFFFRIFIGYLNRDDGENQFTNEADWRPKKPGRRKKILQWSPLTPKKARAKKKRSSMEPIGAQKSAVDEKKVFNGADWRPKKRRR
jgi:hypothetical protein